MGPVNVHLDIDYLIINKAVIDAIQLIKGTFVFSFLLESLTVQ